MIIVDVQIYPRKNLMKNNFKYAGYGKFGKKQANKKVRRLLVLLGKAKKYKKYISHGI